MINPVAVRDPGKDRYFFKGFLLYEDPRGQIIKEYKEIFNSIYDRSEIVTSQELKPHPDQLSRIGEPAH